MEDELSSLNQWLGPATEIIYNYSLDRFSLMVSWPDFVLNEKLERPPYVAKSPLISSHSRSFELQDHSRTFIGIVFTHGPFLVNPFEPLATSGHVLAPESGTAHDQSLYHSEDGR